MNGSFKSYVVIAIGFILMIMVLGFDFSAIIALLPLILVIIAILAIMNMIARHRAEKMMQSFFEEAEKQCTSNSPVDNDVIDVDAKEVDK